MAIIMKNEIEKLKHIRDTLQTEYDKFLNDAEYDYKNLEEFGNIQMTYDERTEQYQNYETSIKNINDNIKEIELRTQNRTF